MNVSAHIILIVIFLRVEQIDAMEKRKILFHIIQLTI